MTTAHLSLILLAAGNARRYGSPKQLQEMDGETLVYRAARAALGSGARCLVVTGAQAPDVTAELADLDLRCVYNPEWSRGMGSSLASGLRAALEGRPEPQGVIIALADQPCLRAADYRRLIDIHRTHPQEIVAAAYDHARIGPPALFPRWCFDDLLALDGDRGARELLRAHAPRVLRVDLPQAAIDIDTPADLARLVPPSVDSG